MKTKGTKFIYVILTVLAAAALTFFAVLASGCKDADDTLNSTPSGMITGDEVEGDGENTDLDDGSDTESQPSGEIDLSKALVIPKSGITKNVTYYGITVDGTYMEVLAFKSGSAYRTAFNTCQVCYGSRTAYFLQSGNNLVCQNCKSQFPLSSVGTSTNTVSCNPYSILATDRADNSSSLIIPYEFLVKAKDMFKIWKLT